MKNINLVQVDVPVDEAQHFRGINYIELNIHNLLGIEERIGSVHPIEVLSEKDIWFIVFKDNHDLDLVFVAEDDAQHDRGYDLMASQKCSHQNALKTPLLVTIHSRPSCSRWS